METATQGVRLANLNWVPGDEQAYRKSLLERIRAGARGDERGRRGRQSARGLGFMRKQNESPTDGSNLFVRDGWYYDAFSFGAGAAFAKTLTFATPQGGSKFLNQTNLTGQGGQIPSGETISLRSIRIYISNLTVPADLQNIISNVSVTFLVRNYPIYQCTPEWFPAGMGGVTLATANVGTVPTGSAAIVSTTNGMPQQSAVYDLKYPYGLDSQEYFSVIFNPEVAFNMVAATGVNPLGVGTTIKVYLEGVKTSLLAG
jgi:hypothetical protein